MSNRGSMPATGSPRRAGPSSSPGRNPEGPPRLRAAGGASGADASATGVAVFDHLRAGGRGFVVTDKRHSGCSRIVSQMGIFRRLQPRASAAMALAADPAAVLADRLRAIAASEVPEDALQPALQAILQASGAQAGALCLFDVRYRLLRLAAEVGLSDEGCRLLRSVRQGDARGWEVPLRSLRDRRIERIEAAPGTHHHLPALVEAPIRSVACVPLCAGETPFGSLVLVALEPRALSEGDIQQLEGPLGEVVRMIAAARRVRAAEATPAAEDAVAAGAAERAELLAVAERERAEMAVALEEAAGQARAAEAARAAVEAELESVRNERGRRDTELAEVRARFDELAARGSAVESETGALRETVAALRTELQVLTAGRDELHAALAELRAERDRLAADAEVVRPAHTPSEDVLGSETAELDPEVIPVVTVSAPVGEEFEPVERSHVPAAAPALAAEPLAGEAGRTRRLVAVLDTDPAWAGAAIDGTDVAVVEPAGDVVTRLTGVTPARLVVNVAAPGALAAMSALRAAGASGRFWGCLSSPTSDKALPLGMIEATTRPLDLDVVLALLAGHAKRGTRVVTAGADGDTLMSLRHALTRQGLSVSMAWDAKQAVDLFDAVRPEVVVLDLDLRPRSAYELVVRLAGASPVPSLVLVYGDEDDTAAGFAAALARKAPASLPVPRDRLLADVLAQSEASPGQRLEKVRALQGGR